MDLNVSPCVTWRGIEDWSPPLGGTLREAAERQQLQPHVALGMFTEPQESELSHRGRTLNSLHPQAGFGLKDISDVTKLRRTLKPVLCGAREPEFGMTFNVSL